MTGCVSWEITGVDCTWRSRPCTCRRTRVYFKPIYQVNSPSKFVHILLCRLVVFRIRATQIIMYSCKLYWSGTPWVLVSSGSPHGGRCPLLTAAGYLNEREMIFWLWFEILPEGHVWSGTRGDGSFSDWRISAATRSGEGPLLSWLLDERRAVVHSEALAS